MKAIELRIGNLFIEEYSSKIIKVIGLEKNKITFSGLFLEKWQAKPIPLTEEWLLKFGFEISGESYIIENFAIEDIHNGEKWYLYMYDEENGCDVNIGIINFVHQLQNLYFALTNEELSL